MVVHQPAWRDYDFSSELYFHIPIQARLVVRDHILVGLGVLHVHPILCHHAARVIVVVLRDFSHGCGGVDVVLPSAADGPD